jgi:hypothetical protein
MKEKDIYGLKRCLRALGIKDHYRSFSSLYFLFILVNGLIDFGIYLVK